MTIWDNLILAYIQEEGGTSVGELAKKDNIRISRSHVSRRCKKLAEHGLLRALANGVYVITDEGEAYLDGKYDAENEVYLDNGADDGPTAGEEPGEI
jgi:Mn-dependent DtxR family transcriptional regulator